jgi:hypothetical protein
MRQYKVKIKDKTVEYVDDRSLALYRAKVYASHGEKPWVTNWKNEVIWRPVENSEKDT